MKIREISTLNKLNILLFFIIFAFRGFTDAIFVSKGIKTNLWINIKYYVLILAIIFLFFQIINKKKFIYMKELKSILIVAFVLALISIIEATINGGIKQSLYDNIFKMILPIIYVFLLLNCMNFDEIYLCMSSALIISFIAYIIEIGTGNFNMANLLSMNFSDSYSPFESHYSAGIAIALCAYFMYYRKNKVLEVISLCFAILTFKRLFVLFAIAIWILPKIIDLNKKISEKSKNICAVIFILLMLVYSYLLLPQSSSIFYKIFNESQNKFTMGRYNLLKQLRVYEYKSTGLGSTTDFLGTRIRNGFN